jgi:Tol biopolymer transport system component
VTTLFESTDERFVYDRPRYSPDGSRIAFSVWDVAAGRGRVHVMNADGTDLRPLAADGVVHTGWPVWSPDGTVLAVDRQRQSGFGPTTIAVLDAADGNIVESAVDVSNGAAKEWAPDGRSLHVSANDSTGAPLPQVLVDPTDGSVTPAPWSGRSYPSWQRLAP